MQRQTDFKHTLTLGCSLSWPSTVLTSNHCGVLKGTAHLLRQMERYNDREKHRFFHSSCLPWLKNYDWIFCYHYVPPLTKCRHHFGSCSHQATIERLRWLVSAPGNGPAFSVCYSTCHHINRCLLLQHLWVCRLCWATIKTVAEPHYSQQVMSCRDFWVQLGMLNEGV